jgi:cysteinyl-tRNA synthetase
MLKLDGVKMSKSLGNLVLARDLMALYEPDHLRYYLLSNHIRTDADYREGALAEVSARYERLKATSIHANTTAPDEPTLSAVRAALDADFDVPAALIALDQACERAASSGNEPVRAAVRSAAAMLGFAFAGARGPATGDFQP